MQNATDAVVIEDFERPFIISTHIGSHTLAFHAATEDWIAGYEIQ